MNLQYKLKNGAKSPERLKNGLIKIFSAENVIIHPGDTEMVSTGVSFKMPEKHIAFFYTPNNNFGFIPVDFKGQLIFPVINNSKDPVSITVGTHIGNLIFIMADNLPLEQVKELK